MSEQNKTLVKRFYEEVFNKKNVKAIDELCAKNFKDNSPMPGQAAGIQGMKDMTVMFAKAFPDGKVKIEEMIAEKDIVSTRFTMTATHKGSMMGEKPTGKKISIHAMDMIRVTNGKAAEAWHQGDEMMVMSQLGIKPPSK